MNKHKWSEDEVNYFVHLYKKHECLWNVKKASYASYKPLREAAFATIRSKMLEKKNLDGLGVQEIKSKINSLRSSFYQLRQRYRYSSICPSSRVGKWYKDMEFLVKRSRNNKEADTANLDSKTGDASKLAETETVSSSLAISTLIGNFQANAEMMQNEMDFIVSETSTDISTVKLESRIEIMNIVRKLYMEKVAPNFSLMFYILAKVIKNKNIEHSLTHNVESFKTEMIKMGYICKETRDGNKMIMENAEQRFERYFYITKIRKLREKRKKPIVYIDERVINLQFKYEKLHNIKGELPPESSVLFLAITQDGLFNELFSNQATEEAFNKWVTDILLGLLKTPSVIVMDHSCIHGEMEATCPITRYSSKTEMLKWLNVNNIPCSSNISRPELFELISRNKRDTKEYRIDRIIRSHGHEVLRLPNNFPGLNLTDVLWNDIVDNNYSAKIMKDTVADTSIQILQKIIIDGILPSFSKKKWNELEKILVMKENEIYQIDVALENMLETYIFK